MTTRLRNSTSWMTLCGLAALAGACGWLYPQDNPHDQARCDPRCATGRVCREGECVAADASVTDGGGDLADAGDGPRADAPVADGTVADRGDAAADKGADNTKSDGTKADGTKTDITKPDAAKPDAAPPPTNCGTRWKQMTSPTTVSLTGIWGSSPSDIFAVGHKGTILHYDGTTWSIMKSTTTAKLTSIWASSSSDVYVVGTKGTILHYDGSSWSPMASGTTSDLAGISGGYPGKMYAVGASGTILHHASGKWTTQISGTTTNLTCVWTSQKASYVYAMSGQKTYIYKSGKWQYDGSSISAAAIWGRSDSDIYAVGDDLFSSVKSAIVHNSGTGWTKYISHPGGVRLLGVWGSGGATFVVGRQGTVLRHDGSSWTMLSTGTSKDFNAVWAGENQMFAVGGGGQIYQHTLPWKPMPHPTKNPYLAAVWGSGPSDVYAVGGTTGDTGCSDILRYNGTAWSTITGGAGWSCVDVVWGSGPKDVYLLSRVWKSINTKIYHYNGSWSLLKTYGARFYAMGGTGPKDVLFAGDGQVVNYNGMLWSAQTTALKGGPRGIWAHSSGKAFAVGYGGAVAHYNGSVWTDMTSKSGTTKNLKEVWGSSPSDVHAVGAAGTLLHYDGTKWSPVATGVSTDLEGIWGASASEVFVVGDKGVALRYFKGKWSRTLTASTEKLQAVWGSSASDVFVVGNRAILHWCGP